MTGTGYDVFIAGAIITALILTVSTLRTRRERERVAALNLAAALRRRAHWESLPTSNPWHRPALDPWASPASNIDSKHVQRNN